MEPVHGVPTAAELAQAVSEWLRGEVMPATDGRLSFHARVAANVVAMLERELVAGPAYAEAHRMRLRGLGVADDAGLAAAIRTGAFDGRLAELLVVLRPSAIEKLQISNPRHLLSEDRPTEEGPP